MLVQHTRPDAARRPTRALRDGISALHEMQRDDGSWEGECAWCPMLTAQYAIAFEIMGLEVSEARRRGMLVYFQRSRANSGVWGLHAHDEENLFVTTLVYVAARLLGAAPDEPWLRPAREMFGREGGGQAIPTWGKAWLALLGLYEWEGVNPVPPEVWALPSWIPMHPASYYCHTRSIYLGLGVLYGQRFVARSTPVVDELRRELYRQPYASIDFSACADRVREADAPFPTTTPVRALFAIARAFERVHPPRFRRRVIESLRARMRADLRASSHLSLSPVNGLLSMLALWAHDPRDPDLNLAIDRFDAWFWEDSKEGARVAGAGSVCWDSAFALQALAAVPAPHETALDSPLDRGTSFLASQQILAAGFDYRSAYRIDPSGGWCFSEVGHGWPVSDCTAEALLALLHAKPEALGRELAARAVGFILRCQNPDGGFGSYEPRKTRFPLEWMNPAEMFGNCMTERSYVECTASCVMALREARIRYPEIHRPRIERAIDQARRFLLAAQNPNGSWNAAWGVRYVYATMFGVRGLLAAGVARSDRSIRSACEWLLAHQRPDGGWGEDPSLEPGYLEAETSRPVQTAWALIGLLAAQEPNRSALGRAALHLASLQLESGQWPDGELAGVFFETALLNYRLYRQYFPVMALAHYERSRTAEGERGKSHGSITTAGRPRSAA